MGIPLRVLILEDSEDDALLTVRELQRGGYDVTFERVETAEAMTAALDNQKWDIVLADYTMPHFSGDTALTLLRSRDLDMPFIFVSGTIGEDRAVAAMRSGANDYIVKGNLKRLLPAVERELRDAEVRRERKRAEKALRESEEKLQRIINGSPAIIFAKDLNGKYLLINSLYEKLFHISKAEIIGKSDYDIFPKEAADALRDADKKALAADKPIEAEEVVSQDDGTHYYISFKFPLYDAEGKPYAVCGIATDITERKKTEATLLEQLDELQRWHRATVDRELMMHEIKEENEKLKKRVEELERKVK